MLKTGIRKQLCKRNSIRYRTAYRFLLLWIRKEEEHNPAVFPSDCIKEVFTNLVKLGQNKVNPGKAT